jgi:hypothetical protein
MELFAITYSINTAFKSASALVSYNADWFQSKRKL